MRKIWIATYVDYCDSKCDGKAGVLGTFLTKEEAKAEVRADIEKWCDNHAGEDYTVDFDKWSAHNKDYSYGSEWNISEHDLEIKED